MKQIIGIDNGVSGGVAIISEKGRVIDVFDSPTIEGENAAKTRRLRRIDWRDLSRKLGPDRWMNTHAFLERPIIGGVGTFAIESSMRAFEATVLILEQKEIPWETIAAKMWQKELCPDGDRWKALGRAFGIIKVSTPISEGVRDALLIAYYGSVILKRRAAEKGR